MPTYPFFYSEAMMRYDLGSTHPLKPIRLKWTVDLIDSYGLFLSSFMLSQPAPATFEDAVKCHSSGYLEALQTAEISPRSSLARYGLGTGDNPIFPNMYEAAMLLCGASVQAAQAVMDGVSVAFNIGGGVQHHAHRERASGFGYVNDAAVAIHRLKQKYKRIAYVDIDVHHGDGVQGLFYDDPNVLTVSIHESGHTLYPGTGFVSEVGIGAGVGSCLNIPCPAYSTDEVWLRGFREGAIPILRKFDPEVIVLQLGADAHAQDPLAHLCLSAEGWLEAVTEVQSLEKPIIAIGGGGYEITTTARMWTLAFAQLAVVKLPNAVPKTYLHYDDIPLLRDGGSYEIDSQTQRNNQQEMDSTLAEIKTLFGLSS